MAENILDSAVEEVLDMFSKELQQTASLLEAERRRQLTSVITAATSKLDRQTVPNVLLASLESV
jgi:hypothetical protein